MRFRAQSAQVLPVHNGTSKFDFSLLVIDHAEGFCLALEYNADLAEAETARGLLEHYENLLRGAVNDPDCRVFDLPLVGSTEREELLLKWNNSREDYSMLIALIGFSRRRSKKHRMPSQSGSEPGN